MNKPYIPQPGGSRSKYKNKIVIRHGIKFHSVKEADRHDVLLLQLKAGDFKTFERQKNYKLVVNGILIATYRCDFVIHNWDGTYRVIDVKSEFTRKLREYQMKRALMLACYGIKIEEVL